MRTLMRTRTRTLTLSVVTAIAAVALAVALLASTLASTLSARGTLMQIQGDVTCDGHVTVVDALYILRHVADLPTEVTDGCVPVGCVYEDLCIIEPATMTPSP